MKGTLIAVCAVGRTRYDVRHDGPTAIDKRPLSGPVEIDRLGVVGDKQYEAGHGGEDQAVYAYDRAAAEWWAAELGRPIPPGTFGENLSVTDLAVTDAVIGERWLIGDDPDHGVVLEVTAPRTPCRTFQTWMDEPHWVKRFTARGDVGTYLRVQRAGTVQAGDPIEVLDRPSHGVTVREVFQATGADPARLRRLLDEGERLHPSMVAKVCKALDRLASTGETGS